MGEGRGNLVNSDMGGRGDEDVFRERPAQFEHAGRLSPRPNKCDGFRWCNPECFK
jgi:hypothetical protein